MNKIKAFKKVLCYKLKMFWGQWTNPFGCLSSRTGKKKFFIIALFNYMFENKNQFFIDGLFLNSKQLYSHYIKGVGYEQRN